MGYEADVVGMIRIRQVYSRNGRNYVAITVPTGIMDLFGWQPGDRLWYYPTTNKGLMMVKVQHSMELMPAFDPLAMPKAKAVRGPRPGSRLEQGLLAEQALSEATDRLVEHQRKQKPSPDAAYTKPSRGKYRKLAAAARRRR